MPMVLQKDRIQPFSPEFPLSWQFGASTWACSLAASVLGKSFRDFSRPACAADSLGLLKYVRALQSPREGVARRGRRDLISRERLVEALLRGCPSTQSWFPIWSQSLLCHAASRLGHCVGGASSSTESRGEGGRKGAGLEKAPGEGEEGEGRQRLPNVASPPSQPGGALGTAGQGPRNAATEGKRAGQEKSRKPRAVSLPGKNIKRLKIKQRGGRGGQGEPPRGGRPHLRGLDGAGSEGHLDLVLGPGQQLDGAVLAETLPVHLEIHGPVVGLDFKGDADFHEAGDVAHRLRPGGAADSARVSPPPRKSGWPGARERKRRREKEEEGLPDPSQPSPSPKAADKILDYLFSLPLIAA